MHLENVGGSQDVPIPIPEQLPGTVAGLKWLDENGDGFFDIGTEPTLSGWQIHVSGTLEGIFFSDNTLTDGSGNYSFPNLTSSVVWTIKEDKQRDVPAETGYMQTYPLIGSIFGNGTGLAVSPPPADAADNGWEVLLTIAEPDQDSLNFGNKLCQITCTAPPDDTLECTESIDPSNTGYPVVISNCPPSDTVYSDVESGSCPLTITRTWIVTDVVGNADTCVQIITVQDTTKPEITAPADVTFDCVLGALDTATYSDNCAIDSVYFVDDTTNFRCPLSITRTWTAVDTCGNSSSDTQSITVQDTTKPEITAPADVTFDCVLGALDTATYSDNCAVDSVYFVDDTTNARCPLSITRTWTAWDTCGNSSSDIQLIVVQDTTRPTITCAANVTVECDAPVNFTEPSASDNCDMFPVIYVVSIDTVAGPGVGEFTYTKSWAATDSCGNVSDTCSQSIIVEACLEVCTFTIGGWGSECPEEQADRPTSTQPGCVRDHFFNFVYPGNIGVTIGDAGGFTAHWSTAAAVEAFLPNGSTPGVLVDDYNDALMTSAGILAAQILALTLNVDYSCAGVFSTLGLSGSSFCYGDDTVPSECGKFAGISIDSFLVIANKAISGQILVLAGYGASLSDVNFTATCLNQLHSSCDPFASLSAIIEGKYAGIPAAATSDGGAESQLPIEFGLDQNYPNPFNPVTVISFSLPVETHVTIEIFNLMGQRVITLVNGTVTAGIHSVTWNGSSVASGIYFYSLKTAEFMATKKMLLLK